MRIVTWNCQRGLTRRWRRLLSQNPDVAVVPECSEKSTVAIERRGYKTLWFGSNSLKGLGCLSKGLVDSSTPSATAKVDCARRGRCPTPFTLLAVWACRTGIKKAENYIGQVYQALISHPEWFDGTPVVLAGI